MDGLKEVDHKLREDDDHPSTNPSCMSRDKSVLDAVGGYTVLHYNTPSNGVNDRSWAEWRGLSP
jgi:hypothetical protein